MPTDEIAPTADTATEPRSSDEDSPSGRRVLRVAAVVLTVPFVAFIAWRGFGSEIAWPFIVLMAYTPYVVAAGILAVAAALVARNRVAAVAAIAALAAGVVLVAPRAVATTPDVEGVPITLMTINLGVGGADVDRVAELVDRYDVDVLSVQELTPEAATALEDRPELDALPHRHTTPIAGNAAGGGLYSAFPLSDHGDLEGVFAIPAATITADGAAPVRVAAVHVASPHRPSQLDAWLTETRALPSPADVPWILAGDFNATIDHAEFRAVLDRGFVDAADAVGAGLDGTWAPEWFVPPVTLDHVLVQNGVGVDSVTVETVDGTDHAAVISELVLPARAR